MSIKFGDYPIRGIDISQFNDNFDQKLPDLSKAKALGCSFVIVRGGYGQVTDKRFSFFWKQAAAVGLKRCLYWYLDYYSYQFVSMTPEQWGIRQARYCWDLIKDDPDHAPVFIDVEKSQYGASVESVWNIVNVIKYNFLREMDQLNGKNNGIYCSVGLLPLIDAKHRGRPLFVANYNDVTMDRLRSQVKAAGFTNLVIFQYASDGDIDEDGIGDGIRLGLDYKTLDLDIWMQSEDSFNEFFANQGTTEIIDIPAEVEPEPADLVLKKVEVTTSKLNIRPDGSTEKERIGFLRSGSKVALETESGDWGKITGWINLKHTKTI